MRAGIRLTKIDEMINNHYQHIWDCCCDHGLLGLALLKRHGANTIHFIDIVEPLITKLHTQLLTHFASNLNAWQTHCLDVTKIPLSKQPTVNPTNLERSTYAGHLSSGKHLIIIAGVGGDLLIELVTAIVRQHAQQELEFMLCPVHHNYKVRQALISLDFSLINEAIVKENKRFYEIIHVVVNPKANKSQLKPIAVVGSSMWDFSCVEHQQYFNETINHYQRMLNNPNGNANAILAAYKKLPIKGVQ